MSTFRRPAIVATLLSLVACSTPSPNDPRGQPFGAEALLKTDVDAVFDAMIQEEMTLLEELMGKLYRRNPRELAKAPLMTIDYRVSQVFRDPVDVPVEFEGMRGIEVLRRTLDPEYVGDRVLGVVYGLATMVRNSYDGDRHFYLTDTLDPQKLYNAARNIEIAVWKLSNQTGPDQEPLLLTNTTHEEGPANLSYERLFGKLIGIQDLAARVVADRSDRTLRYIIQGLATAVLLPV